MYNILQSTIFLCYSSAAIHFQVKLCLPGICHIQNRTCDSSTCYTICYTTCNRRCNMCLYTAYLPATISMVERAHRGAHSEIVVQKNRPFTLGLNIKEDLTANPPMCLLVYIYWGLLWHPLFLRWCQHRWSGPLNWLPRKKQATTRTSLYQLEWQQKPEQD